MAYTIPTGEPDSFTQGETVKWYKSFADFEPADWTLSYNFVGPSTFTVTATTSGGVFLSTISSTDSASYADGDYYYQAQVTNGTETYVVKNGTTTILATLANEKAGYDGRSHAQKVLDSIEAVIEGRASQSDKEIEIDGRRIDRLTPRELMQFHSAYKAKVRAEKNAERRENGEPARKGIYTQFRAY